jgi:hypothetical protein
VYLEKLIVAEPGNKFLLLKENRTTYLDVNVQIFRGKRFWTKGLGILTHK